MSPVSVVMVSASFHPHVGGAEKQALELSTALARQGHKVRVLTRRLPGLAAQEEISGIAVRRLWAPGVGVLNALGFMLSLLVELFRSPGSYDAIHVHLAGSPALSAALAGRLLGKRVVVKLGGGRGIGELAASSRSFSGRLKLKALSWLGPKLAAVTQDLADEAREFGFTGDIVVQPNGVDLSRYRPSTPEEKQAIRRRLGWPEGPCFLYVGRLSPEKRLLPFLEAWSAVFEGTPAFAVLYGDGPEKEGLLALAVGLGPARVRVYPSMAEIEQAYRAADIFFLPSVSEGLSNALLEAMASGLGIIASRVGGSRVVLEEGKTGLLFEPENSTELKDKLALLKASPGLAGALGTKASAAAKIFGIDEVAARYAGIYGG